MQRAAELQASAGSPSPFLALTGCKTLVVALAGGGIVAMLVAALGLAPDLLSDTPPAGSKAAIARPGDFTVSSVPFLTDADLPGEPQVMTYEPGESSGWHLHEGVVHSVLVLAGTMTVYGEDCQPRVYSAGDRYLGGLQPHLVRNETNTPLEMAVAY
jgi:quercetin dioxygenase-like cupin family protein